MISSPTYLEPITQQDDAESDMDLLLAATAKPLSEQARAVGALLESDNVPHSDLLGRCLAGLLGFGPDPDARELALVIENSAFSPRGEQNLIFGLADQLRTNPRIKEHLRSLLVTLLPRYFLEESESPSGGPDSISEAGSADTPSRDAPTGWFSGGATVRRPGIAGATVQS